MEDSALFSATFKLLDDRPRRITLAILEKETGIPEEWLKKFGQGVIGDPGVIRVEKLFVALTGKPLDLTYAV
jgi:hypothetical protein